MHQWWYRRTDFDLEPGDRLLRDYRTTQSSNQRSTSIGWLSLSSISCQCRVSHVNVVGLRMYYKWRVNLSDERQRFRLRVSHWLIGHSSIARRRHENRNLLGIFFNPSIPDCGVLWRIHLITYMIGLDKQLI